MSLGAVLLLVVAGVVVWGVVGSRGYYTYAPGSAPTITPSTACRSGAGGGLVLPTGTPCARITVPAGKASQLHGRLLMVDVLVGQTTVGEYLEREVGLLGTVHPGAQLLPAAAVRGDTPASQLGCQDAEEMGSATETAPLVALRRLGYAVGATNHGGLVALVLPHSGAAAAGIRCGDTITAIDGAATPTAASIETAVRRHHPGDPLTVTVRRQVDGRSTAVTLHATLTGVPAQGGQPAEPRTAFLGVATETDTTYSLPFPVSIQVGDIGGPSAGLALTLGVLDTLSGGRLTGGHTVAATGTISPDGSVGDVSGVAQKTVAVQAAGATLFLVPPQELAVARRAARPGLRVEAVTDVSQALADLRAIGGQLPASHPAG